jgi:diadenosine tetraphosphate (Ap4A) HIT family hydrolase
MAMDEAAIAARFLKTEFAVSKINFAAIRNVVSQLHLHVVGRRATDPCWPAPVWGNLDADGYSFRADCHSYRNVDSKSFAEGLFNTQRREVRSRSNA